MSRYDTLIAFVGLALMLGIYAARPSYGTDLKIKGGAEWMMKMQRDNEFFRYEYYPATDTYSSLNNIVRQAGAAYALAQAANYFHENKYFDASKMAIDAILDFSKARQFDGQTARSILFNGAIKNNTNAMLILGILELGKEDPEILTQYRQALNELAGHIIASQSPIGFFYDRYDEKTSQYSKNIDYDYNNGESFLALSELQKIFPDNEYEKTLLIAAPSLMRLYGAEWNKAFYAWGARGFLSFYASHPDPAYKDFIFRTTDFMLKTDYFSGDKTTIALGVFLEGLISTVQFAEQSGDMRRASEYRRAAIDGLKRLSTLQILEQNDFEDAVFQTIKGGFCGDIFCESIRIDNNQHGVAAFIAGKNHGIIK